MSDRSFNSMDPRPELRSISDFRLNISGASGSSIMYKGYFEAEVCVPQTEHEPEFVSILVVPTTTFYDQVPLIVGTNIIVWLGELAHGAALLQLGVLLLQFLPVYIGSLLSQQTKRL